MKNESAILQHRAKLRDYEGFLRDDSNLLSKHARRVEKEFMDLHQLPGGVQTISNATFFTAWNHTFKIPLFVAEYVEKATSNDVFTSSKFFPDPK